MSFLWYDGRTAWRNYRIESNDSNLSIFDGDIDLNFFTHYRFIDKIKTSKFENTIRIY